MAAAILVAGTAGPAMGAGELSEHGSQSFSEIAACTAQSGTLLASIVVDESLSLRSTDPAARRVEAVLTALDSLERLGEGGELDVEANLAVFGDSFTELVGWGAIEPSGEHLEKLRSAAESELPGRDRSNFTDYRKALLGAQSSLGQREEEVDGASCKMVLWLTDGRLDVDGVGDGPETEAAREELCRSGGIVDSVRADGVAIIAMGLMTSEGQAATNDVDRDRLRAIAEGTAGAESCGTTPVPANVTNGAFLNADDASALNRLFAQMGALLEGLTPGDSYTCPDSDCIEGRLQIPVDAGVGGFRLVVEVEPGAPNLQLSAPDGTTAPIDADVSEIAGATVSMLPSGSLRTVDVATSAAADDTGVWTLVTDPSVTTLVDLYYFWDVTLTVEAPNGVVIGQSSPVEIVPRDAAGSPIDLATYESIDLVAGVNDVDTTFSPAHDRWTTELSVPVDAAVSSLQIEGSVSAVTAPHGIELGPIRVERQLITEFPPSFPTFTPARLDVGRMVGSTTAETILTVTGADRGPTRVCFVGSEVSAPEAAGSASLTPGVDCADVETGATVEVPVRLEVADIADGRVSATLTAQLYGVDPGEPIAVDVPVTATMIRPVDNALRIGLASLLVVLALAVAWAAASVTRRFYGRYQLSAFAKYASVPVTIGGAGPRRADDAPELLSAHEFKALPVRGKQRQFTAGPVEHRVELPVNPWAEPRALVRGAFTPGVPVTHNSRSSRYPAERFTDFPGSTGFVILTDRPSASSDRETISGTLVLVVDPGEKSTVAQLLPDRLAELGRVNWGTEVTRAHETWGKLAEAETESQQAASAGPRLRRRPAEKRKVGIAPVGRAPEDAATPPPPRPRTADAPPPPRDARPRPSARNQDPVPPWNPARGDDDRPSSSTPPPPPPPRR